MHYCVTVALPGILDGADVEAALRIALDPHYEEEWDWFVVGGRWGNYWTLKPGALPGPLDTEAPAIGGVRTPDDERRHADCARLEDIEAESLVAPYSWVDQWGAWHSKWLGPDGSGSQNTKDWEYPDDVHTEAYMIWIETLPKNTWLVNVDCHN
jgi:hypothetical protein